LPLHEGYERGVLPNTKQINRAPKKIKHPLPPRQT
jgi:hypothetical protein